MRIFRETRPVCARAGLLCLLVTLGAGLAGAADAPPSAKADAAGSWRVALALFPRVGEAALAETTAQDFSLAKARSLAASAANDALSSTFPSLVQRVLSPLPDRRAEPGKPLATAFADLSGVAAKGGAATAPFIDLAAQKSPAASVETPGDQPDALVENSGWDGLVAGFFTLAGEQIDCRVLLFESGMTAVSRVLTWRGEIASLDRFAETMLPSIVSWIAGKDLGVVDIMPQPGNGPPLALALDSEAGKGILKGSRLYCEAEGDFSLRAERIGFEPRSIEIRGARPGNYRKEFVSLTPAAAKLSEVPLADAGSILGWKESDLFRRSEKSYRSALGRFVVSVPLTAIAFGVFFSYSEAYARGAASDAAYYASGACAAAAAGLSVCFLVESAIGLVNVLNASK